MEANTPMFGAMEIFDNAFEERVVEFSWSGCKFGECGDGISDIESTGDIAVHEFAKKGAIRETLFLFKFAMCRGAFKRSTSASAEEGFVQLVDTIFWERRSRAIVRLSEGGIIFPIMGANDTIYVVCARDFDVGLALGDINAVEVFKFTKIVDGRLVFEGKLHFLSNELENFLGCTFEAAGDSQIIDLTQQ